MSSYRLLDDDSWIDISEDMGGRMGPDRDYSHGVWVDLRPEAPSDLVRNIFRKCLPASAFSELELYTERLLHFFKAYKRSDKVSKQDIESCGDEEWRWLAAEYGKYGNGPLLSGAVIRNGAAIIERISRPIIALIGGLFLLVPMIIMSFVDQANNRLIIVSIFVAFFSTACAMASKASNQELVSATAAYAAVLVVYIGTTSPTSS